MALNVVDDIGGQVIPDLQNAPEKAVLLSGTQDPTSDGVHARLGSIFLRKVTPAEAYQKIGPLATDWQLIGAGGGGVTVSSTNQSIPQINLPPTNPFLYETTTPLVLAGGESVLVEVTFQIATSGFSTYALDISRNGVSVGALSFDGQQDLSDTKTVTIVGLLTSQPAGSFTFGAILTLSAGPGIAVNDRSVTATVL